MARKYRVVRDCLCEHYTHEVVRHNRSDLPEKRLKAGEIVTYVNEWVNFYGSYIRVSFNGETYDILPENLEELPANYDERCP